MTRFVLTVACHVDDLDDALNLAVCLGWLNGYTPSEWWGAFGGQFVDGQGQDWRALSLAVDDAFLQATSIETPVERPAADTANEVNLTGARRAQAKLVVWRAWEGGDIPQVQADRIVATVGIAGAVAVAGMGLQRVGDLT